jgi:hypothetical protein
MRWLILTVAWIGLGVAAVGQTAEPAPGLHDGLVPGSTEQVTLWWTDATRKVMRDEPPPDRSSERMVLAAARGEFEPVQLVVRPLEELKRLRAVARPLKGASGAVIPPQHVDVLRVQCVDVHTPTDKTGSVGPWPDPLPPLGDGVDVPGGANQPLWVVIEVPRDAVAGDYEGRIELRAGAWSAEVPVRLHVWDFTLPPETHLTTALGFSPHNVFRYHRLKTEQQQREVLEKYWQSFSEHRISPYDPAPLDPIRVRFTDELTAEFDFAAWDQAMARAFEVYHFNSFRLRPQGLGEGTFHSRQAGSLAGHAQGSPEYEQLMADYLGKLEAHLRAKGWLDKAYVYWFDEPQPKDYEFVRTGMDLLERHAPGLRRMLTEQPEEALFGAVDLWCPITHAYRHEAGEARRAEGETFWWYVCCSPKAPWCTLFIDHPATELRVWLWQTWQHKMSGILVWATNYWTSSAAFPDSLQNPYEDPMSYVSGYSTEKGVKRHWGNGDGRFIYPPLAATGGEGPPVLDGPVSSIRWEMLREGIEDLEYLYRLRELLRDGGSSLDEATRNEAQALLIVPPEITSNLTDFTKDGDPIYAHRAKVAGMIERLSR